MKRLVTICILTSLIAAGGLAGGDKQWFQKLVTERYAPTVKAALLPTAMSGSQKSFKTEDTQWQYIYSFFRGYLHGLENTPGTMTVGEVGGPHQTGFEDGLRHFQQLQGCTNQPFGLLDFGYDPVTAHGTFKWAFEESSFQPEGTNKNWWVNFQVGVTERFAAKRSVNKDSLFDVRRPCTFKGFLSPDQIGSTGHMNQYDRDFIVTEILDVRLVPAKAVDEEIKVKIEDGPSG